MLHYIVAIFGMLMLSLLVGLPLAYYLTPQDDSGFFRKLTYISALCGFSIIHLVFFAFMMCNGSGTRPITVPAMALLAFGLTAFIVLARNGLRSVNLVRPWPITLFIAVMFFASFHVSLPVLTGQWEMAYGTGDDAARWYMVVNYFQDKPFKFMEVTDYSLRWPMRDRPLQNISGAIVASIFKGITNAYAYSASAALFAIMAAIAFCLAYESLFGLRKPRHAYLLWAAAAGFVGLFGSMTNILYTGRTTHYCSIYPVLACLGYAAVRDKGARRGLWYAFWFVLLSYYYTNRYIAFSGFMLAAMFLAQWAAGQANFRTTLRNGFLLLAGAVAGLLATWDEMVLIVQSVMGSGAKYYLTLQKEAGYGADGTTIDRLFKWSGLIGTYESLSNIPTIALLLLGAGICFTIAVALYISVRNFKQSPGFSGLFLANTAMATALFLTGNYFIAWKSSLYWPFFVLLGYLNASFLLLNLDNKIGRSIGFFFLAGMAIYTAGTGRQILYYTDLANERYTKVDDGMNRLKDNVDAFFSQCVNCKGKTIFGYDMSMERHLLLREVFHAYDWQPVRGDQLYFEHDMINRNNIVFENYDYDAILVAKAFKCSPVDFSGNSRFTLYEDGPFTLFSGEASAIDFIKGFTLAPHGSYDPEAMCLHYGHEMTPSQAQAVFANHGRHNWLEFTVWVEGPPTDDTPPFTASITPSDSIRVAVEHKNDNATAYVMRFEGLNGNILNTITFAMKQGAPRMMLVSTRWGY